MLPRVSVVTCSYNRPKMLRAAIESLRAQTDGRWEHLIYDDASTDPQVAEVLEWAALDPRVRVWRRSTNQDRPSKLWNYMLDRAHGEYFTVLDDDNEKMPRFIEVLAGELDADPEIDFVTCGSVNIDPERTVTSSMNLHTTVAALDQSNTCDGGALLYRRAFFERVGYFSEALRTNEDWDWLRRAVRVGKAKHVTEALAVYRSHASDFGSFEQANRMVRREDLGHTSDVDRVRGRQFYSTVGVNLVLPLRDRLTQSQADVAQHLRDALSKIAWVKEGSDIALLAMPFQLTREEVLRGVDGCTRALLLHVEDPAALAINSMRIQDAILTGAETWVSTNDASTANIYREMVGGRVIVCPMLGSGLGADYVAGHTVDRDIDVLFCGYAYASRKKFMDDFLGKLPSTWKVVIVGDGWDHLKDRAEVYPTQGTLDSYRFHLRARAVVCFHRQHEDNVGAVPPPASVNRGTMEGYFGPRVFVDSTRSRHPFDDGDVVQFQGPDDLAYLVDDYLRGPRAPEADAFMGKCRLLYTYRTRLARILSSVLSPRSMVEIP